MPTTPTVRDLAASVRSAASAAQAASSGSVPRGCSANQAESCGILAEKPSFLTERCSICPIGTTKVSRMNSRSGSTNRKARRRARRELRASADFSGRPSAVFSVPPSARPPASVTMAAWGSSALAILGAFDQFVIRKTMARPEPGHDARFSSPPARS
ncbi:MAG: hypothetical protein QM733_24955 [Ilumatobacteraceae bacterium]